MQLRLLGGNDSLGEYIQGRKSLIETKGAIESLAKIEGVSPTELLYVQTVYYQCDTGSYTADAGGLRYLEHMFEYYDGAKVYDPDSQLLIFAEPHRTKYAALRHALLNTETNPSIKFELPAHITFIDGNIFSSTCQTLVNTVNCVGVMGRGIALVHRLRYPAMFEQYKEYCRDGRISIGKLFLYTKTDGEPWILNFPTKDDWKNPSKMEFIETGLQKFAETWEAKGITLANYDGIGLKTLEKAFALVRNADPNQVGVQEKLI